MPLHPRKESLNDPAPLVTAQSPSVLRCAFDAVGFVWRDHLNPLLAKFGIQRVAVVGAIADQIVRLCLNHVEVERQLHQSDFVVVRRVRGDGQRQPMPIYYRHDFYAFSSAPSRSNLLTAALRRCKRRIDITLGLVDPALIAKRICQLREPHE